ncbi:MAG TPA: uracil-DNA glycosylase [Longimicrobiales bacterium]|nr:uracil-DNA glycosylase [Longimicrobiales bacterium]
MTLDRALLARYLRQRAELAGPELLLDELTAEELVRLLAGDAARGATAPVSAADAKAALREMLGGGDAAGRGPRPGPTPRPSDRPAAPRPPAAPVAASARPAGPTAADDRGRADVAAALAALKDEVAVCGRCRLAQGRTQAVFGEGNPLAELVVVGEAPGQEEDRTGRPFVGPAGKLLDRLLMSAGFPRRDVYICNVLKSRPPNNRNPQPDEIAACTPWLRRQLELIRPKVLLAVGKFAAQHLAGSEESIGRLRGRVLSYEGIPLVVSYHPAFLLRSPQWTRTAWQDFQLARKVLDEQA